ncbi:MAG: HD domain-containing protein [Actinomycetota bacterium]|nr:HD domain-containing protein [Actinomycetota bacterium]
MESSEESQLSERFKDALVYAAQVHAGQTRKGSAVPYVSHLLSVCGLVLEHGGSEEEAIAALLHDAVEDRPDRTSLEKIEERFGDEVARIVRGCSDTVTHPKPQWRPRKERYLRHLESVDEAILRVSCADKLHNVRTMLTDLRKDGDKFWDRFNAGREEQLWYHRSLAEVFARRFPGPLCEELQRGVEELVEEATA